MVTDEQVSLLRRKLMQGKTQEQAAAKADMSVRSARKWKDGPMPSQRRRERRWRTRQDPFEGVWEERILPWLRADHRGELEATTLLDHLVEEDPERFSSKQLRTLQRRIREWRAVEGPQREVYFAQEHPPGREASFDFTYANDLAVTIRGEPFDHRLFQLRLSCSGQVYVELAFAETYEAMLRGLQNGLWTLGGVTDVLRHDNLSAATHELKKAGGRALNRRFQDFLDHYALRSTRIRPGESHENGGVEKAHDLLKRALRQALQLRGHRDFESIEAYESFVREVVERRLNAKRAEAFEQERGHLRELPPTRLPEYTVHRLKVRRWSTLPCWIARTRSARA